ncbi:MAG: T9SS type A sorting domain-containing protein, partial [Bacteroidia bacterium]
NNIIVNNINGSGVYFGSNTGTATLSAGNTITVGAGGFASGTLSLRDFTQLGGTPQSITLTGSGSLTYGPASTFGGNVTSVSPTLYFHGCTFSGTTNCTKNGTTSDQSNGGNIFNGVSNITNSGAGYLLFSNGTLDQFSTNVTFNNTGTSGIYPAYNSANNTFNGLVTLNNTPSSPAGFINFAPYNTGTQINNNVIVNQTQGITYFGNNLTAGNFVTQANGFTINSGTISGGDLYLYNYKQAGSTTGNVSIINNTSPTAGNLFINNSTFYDNFSGIYPNIRNVQASTFNGTTTLTKTGGNNQEVWYGGNSFNGSTTITNQASTISYYLYIAGSAADAYNGDVSFVQASNANIYPNYNTNCLYAGNVTVTSPSTNTVTFGNAAGGIATMTNTSAQGISKGNAATPNPTFTRLVMNKASNAVTLNTRINVSSYLTMTGGTINTTSVNIVNMNNASTANIGNSSSYINGPMNYDMALNGSTILNFPIGKLADWRPAILALKHSAATPYTYNAEVFDAPAPTTWTFPATIDTVSGVHYWTINRYTTGTTTSVPATGLSGNQIITLYFDVNDQVYDGANLTIVKNTAGAPTAWIDIGGTGGPAALGGIALAGSVTSTSNPSAFNSFSTFTLGSKIGVWNPLPVEMLYFTAKPVEENVELDWATATEVNNSKFEVERSKNGTDFDYVTTVNAHGNGNSTQTQTYQSFDTKPYSGTSYYRLKQIDKNGAFKYTNIAQVNFDKKSFVAVYPNPAVNSILVNVSTDYDNATAKIMDALGREVLSQNISAAMVNTINATTLESGMYYVIISNGTDVTKTKITIQK